MTLPSILSDEPPWPETGHRLPWTLAVPLLGGLVAGLWLFLWAFAELVLAG